MLGLFIYMYVYGKQLLCFCIMYKVTDKHNTFAYSIIVFFLFEWKLSHIISMYMKML